MCPSKTYTSWHTTVCYQWHWLRLPTMHILSSTALATRAFQCLAGPWPGRNTMMDGFWIWIYGYIWGMQIWMEIHDLGNHVHLIPYQIFGERPGVDPSRQSRFFSRKNGEITFSCWGRQAPPGGWTTSSTSPSTRRSRLEAVLSRLPGIYTLVSG